MLQEINKEILIYLNSLLKFNFIDITTLCFADTPIFFIPIFLIISWIYYSINKKATLLDKEKLLYIFYSIVIWLGISLIIQHIVHIDRPESVLKWVWKLLLKHIPDASFPSDHATVSIAFLTSLFLAWYKKIWLVFTPFVILMLLSRVILGVHWPFDIIAWSLVWIFSSYFTFRYLVKFKFVNKINQFIIKIMLYIKLQIMSHLKEKNKVTIALTWGSTWGHIFPLLSLYNYFKEENNYNFIWVWEEDSLEEEISKKNNIKFLNIQAWKIRRYYDKRNFYEPLKNLTWIYFWIHYILKYKIDIVFSKWWYVSIPLCIAAFILRKKIYVHESDIVWWISNKIIWTIANKIFYTFENEKIDNKKHIYSWQILNPKLIDWLDNLNIEANTRLNVVVIAWSQWSTIIFESLIKILPELKDVKFQVILWEKNLHFKKRFEEFHNVVTYDFLSQKKLGKLLKNIDIAITRWWATTIWELNMFAIHSIIVPLKNSAWNHQNINAKYFNKKYWSDILDQENNLDKELLSKLIKYKHHRKTWLNLDWFFKPLQIIEKELEK